ncbi:type 4a pilus biogenesis protein PilO [Orenia marismortui]|uniref:type 4a pilus biogenesis protein PilO n=1 Tax=Orenia marismortui TaxID=46469 RepID=UPI0014170D19|nr:type 4a pilus biogenesis protein PilO [Orenia marismortui]
MLLNKLQPREKKLLISFASLLLIFGFYYLYSNQTESLDINRSNLDSSIRDLRINSNKIGKSTVLKAKYEKLLDELDNRQKNFLKQGEEINFLLDLNDLSLNTGVSLLSIKPGKVTQEDIYLKVPIELKIQGSYDKIVKYMEKIKSLSYLTRIEKINILSQKGLAGNLKVEMTLMSYALDRREVK